MSAYLVDWFLDFPLAPLFPLLVLVCEAFLLLPPGTLLTFLPNNLRSIDRYY